MGQNIGTIVNESHQCTLLWQISPCQIVSYSAPKPSQWILLKSSWATVSYWVGGLRAEAAPENAEKVEFFSKRALWLLLLRPGMWSCCGIKVRGRLATQQARFPSWLHHSWLHGHGLAPWSVSLCLSFLTHRMGLMVQLLSRLKEINHIKRLTQRSQYT